MKKSLLCVCIYCISYAAIAQYDPVAVNYGVVTTKNLGNANELGAGVRIEYAYNCSTTYMAEYTRMFSLGGEESADGYNELALGVNLILFNWYPTTITAGFGYVVNDSSFYQEVKGDNSIGISSGDLHHGAQIKLRALHEVTSSIHIFGELNIKSLGRRYDTFLIGFSYDFYGR